MPVIKDSAYKRFFKQGLIQPVEKAEFESYLAKVKHPRYQKQARVLFILIYYTGKRPAEIIELQAGNIEKDRTHVKILFPTKKGGRANLMYYPLNEHFKEVLDYSQSLFPNTFIGYGFKASPHSTKTIVKWKDKQGLPHSKRYYRSNRQLWYWFKKWFGITPYFFRHNRFSDMAKRGASLQEIAHAKGAADVSSVQPYLHLSKLQAKKMVKYFR